MKSNSEKTALEELIYAENEELVISLDSNFNSGSLWWTRTGAQQ